jgi:RecA-family ATPase
MIQPHAPKAELEAGLVQESKQATWACIPEELRARNQWCFTSPTREPVKAPRTRGGQLASCHKPAQWLSFDEACSMAMESGGHVGYVLTREDPFCCIDLDVKDDTPKDWLAGHEQLVDDFDSYTELSTGGRGRHIWIRGQVEKGLNRHSVEVYSQERFIICTGRVCRDRPIASRDELLTRVADAMKSSRGVEEIEGEPEDDPEANPSWYVALQAFDEEGLARQNELGRLFQGDWEGRYRSHSEADLALMTMLHTFTTSHVQCINAFQLSGLAKRDKAKRRGYMLSTVREAWRRVQENAVAIAHGQQLSDALLSQMTRDLRGPAASHSSSQRKRFNIFSEKELEDFAPPEWLVKGLIPSRGIGSIYGLSGSGKTFLTIHLLAHIANGWPWFGRRVKARPVVYVPLEGQAGIPVRIAAWRKHMQQVYGGDPSSNIHFVFDALDVRKQLDRDALVQALIGEGLKGAVLCIDTLAQSAPGVEENSSEGMGEVLAGLQELERRLEAVVIVIHHTGKVVERGMRGWSGLHAAMDFALECQTTSKRGERQVQVAKVKDGEANFSLRFNTVQIQLHVDEDGEQLTSLAISPVFDAVPGAESERLVQSDIDDDNFIWGWVDEKAKLGDEPSSNSLQSQLAEMKNQRAISQVRVRKAVYRLLAQGRLVHEKSVRHNNQYLVAVERRTPGSESR